MKRLIFGVLLAQFLFSCNNDLEIYSEKTDLPYIYGVITANNSDHYIKVTKTFQKLAKDVVFEDLYYHDDSVKVYIDVFNNNNLINSHLATPVESQDKVEGIFPSPTQKYYKVSNTPLYNNISNTYSIRVELTNGEVITNAKNFALLNSIDLERPQLNFQGATAEIGFESVSSNVLVPYVFKWDHNGGGREDASLILSIQETNTVTNKIDTIEVPIQIYNDIPANEGVNAPLHLTNLMRKISEKLEKNPDIQRRMLNTTTATAFGGDEIRGYGVGLEIWTQSKDLSTYETILFSQDGISQDKPNYTNLDGALGMFSTNIKRVETPESNKLYFGSLTLDSLACSKASYDYNFSRVYLINNGAGSLVGFDDTPSRCSSL